jgi:hypothetical protein
MPKVKERRKGGTESDFVREQCPRGACHVKSSQVINCGDPNGDGGSVAALNESTACLEVDKLCMEELVRVRTYH